MKRRAGRAAALDAEAEHRAAALGQQLLRQRMVGMRSAAPDRRPRRPPDARPGTPLPCACSRRGAPCAAAASRCPAGCANAVVRAHARAEVAQAFAPRAQQERADRRFFGEHHVVEAVVRFATARRICRTLPSRRCRRPPARRRSRCRGRREIWSRSGRRRSAPSSNGCIRYGVVNVESTSSGRPASCAICGHARDVEHVEAGIAQRFAEQQPRIRADRGAPTRRRRAD